MTLPTDRDKAQKAKERVNKQSNKPFDVVGYLCPACNEPVTYGEPDPNEYIPDETPPGYGVDRFAFEFSPQRIQDSNHENPWDAVHVVPETVEIPAAEGQEPEEQLRVAAYKHDYTDEGYEMWKEELNEIEKNEQRAEVNQGFDDFATSGEGS